MSERPDYQRIARLEQELLADPVKTASARLAGHLVLLDSEGKDASERVPVTVSLRVRSDRVELRINEAPITLTPSRFGTLRPVIFYDDGEGWAPACNGDTFDLREGDTFSLVEQ